MQMRLASKTWFGSQLLARARSAISVGVARITNRAVEHSKLLVDVETGELQESIHGAAPESGGEMSEYYQEFAAEDVAWSEWEATAEFGSWLDYACVEEATGTSYVEPAAEMLRTESDALMVGAFREAGL